MGPDGSLEAKGPIRGVQIAAPEQTINITDPQPATNIKVPPERQFGDPVQHEWKLVHIESLRGGGVQDAQSGPAGIVQQAGFNFQSAILAFENSGGHIES